MTSTSRQSAVNHPQGNPHPLPPLPRINPAAMGITELAGMLARVRGGVTEAMIRADLDAGAPANPDGSVNLVHYAAWLVRQSAQRKGAAHGD